MGSIALALADAALKSVKEGRAVKVSEVSGALATKRVPGPLIPDARIPERGAGQLYFNSHSCSAALWNFQVRFGPAMTLR